MEGWGWEGNDDELIMSMHRLEAKEWKVESGKWKMENGKWK